MIKVIWNKVEEFRIGDLIVARCIGEAPIVLIVVHLPERLTLINVATGMEHFVNFKHTSDAVSVKVKDMPKGFIYEKLESTIEL